MGEAYGERHPSETHRPGGSLNTTAFLHVLLRINPFCPSFRFLGESLLSLFSRDIFFFPKVKENGDNGLEGEDTQSKKKKKKMKTTVKRL